MAAAVTSLQELPFDVFNDLLPFLDLASALSLSIASKSISHKVYDNLWRRRIHVTSADEKFDKHPLSQVFVDAVENGFEALLEEYLAAFRDNLMVMDDYSLSLVIGSCLKHNRYNWAQRIMAAVPRRWPMHLRLFHFLGESGSVALVEKVLAQFELELTEEISDEIILGAVSRESFEILEWIVERSPSSTRNVIIISALRGKLDYLKWGIEHSTLPDLRNVLVAALGLASDAPNSLAMMNFLWERVGTYDPLLLARAAHLGRIDVYNWAITTKRIEFDLELVISSALRNSQFEFIEFILKKYTPNLKAMEYSILLSTSIASLKPAVVDYASGRLEVPFHGLLVFVVFLSNYQGRPEDHEFWTHLEQKVLGEETPKIIDFFKKKYKTVWKYYRFPDRAKFDGRSFEFFESLGFPASEINPQQIASKLTVHGLRWLLEKYPAIIDTNALIPHLALAGKVSCLKVLLQGDRSLASALKEHTLLSLLTKNSRHVLECLHQFDPSIFHYQELLVQLFSNFEWLLSSPLSLQLSNWDSLHFLLEHGAEMDSNFFRLVASPIWETLPASLQRVLQRNLKS